MDFQLPSIALIYNYITPVLFYTARFNSKRERKEKRVHPFDVNVAKDG